MRSLGFFLRWMPEPHDKRRQVSPAYISSAGYCPVPDITLCLEFRSGERGGVPTSRAGEQSWSWYWHCCTTHPSIRITLGGTRYDPPRRRQRRSGTASERHDQNLSRAGAGLRSPPALRLAGLSGRRILGGAGLARPLVDQSGGEPHVGLHLRLIAQEDARSARLEPAGERAHFLGRQRRESRDCIVWHGGLLRSSGQAGCGPGTTSVTPQSAESSRGAVKAAPPCYCP
jgi:hypothetical protein